MTNVESWTSMVLFHDRPGSSDDSSPDPVPAAESLDYLRARERAERAAAKAALTAKARHVHQELAQFYAGQIHQRSGSRRA